MTALFSQNKAQKLREMVISSTFKYIESRSIDSKARINIGQSLKELLEKLGPIDSMNIFLDDRGNLLLVPMQHIPANEMWIWNDPKIQDSFKSASDDVMEGRITEVENLDDFLDSL